MSSSNAPVRERARTLYQELTNEQATWVDAVFWMVIGALVAELVHWIARVP